MKLEEIKLNDDELLVILGGNDDHEQTTYNCGLGCGNGCGNGCGSCAEQPSDPEPQHPIFAPTSI